MCAKREICPGFLANVDPELAAVVAHNAASGLDRLLAAQQAGEVIPCHEIGAILRLIRQEMDRSKPVA